VCVRNLPGIIAPRQDIQSRTYVRHARGVCFHHFVFFIFPDPEPQIPDPNSFFGAFYWFAASLVVFMVFGSKLYIYIYIYVYIYISNVFILRVLDSGPSLCPISSQVPSRQFHSSSRPCNFQKPRKLPMHFIISNGFHNCDQMCIKFECVSNMCVCLSCLRLLMNLLTSH